VITAFNGQTLMDSSFECKPVINHTVNFMLNGDIRVVTINIEDDGIPFNPLEKKIRNYP
jgi:hypothetical protein